MEYKKAMEIYKRMCESIAEAELRCVGCPLNALSITDCEGYLIRDAEEVEPILKKWDAENPVLVDWDTARDAMIKGAVYKYPPALEGFQHNYTFHDSYFCRVENGDEYTSSYLTIDMIKGKWELIE